MIELQITGLEEGIKVIMFDIFSLTPMGVLAPRLLTLDVFAHRSGLNWINVGQSGSMRVNQGQSESIMVKRGQLWLNRVT